MFDVVVLRAVSLVGLLVWLGGLLTLGIAQFQQWTWAIGGLLAVLLVVRALLGPRPRRLGVRLTTVLGMLALAFATPRWIAPRTAMIVTLAAGVGLIWLEAADTDR